MMKIKYCLILIIALITGTCQDSGKDQSNYPNLGDSNKKNLGIVRISEDTLMAGDIFITTGPAGVMQEMQGKIVLIADSGEVMPVVMKDDSLIAIGLTNNMTYKLKKEGDRTSFTSSDPNNLSGSGKMMFLTDNGEMLEVRFVGSQMVVLTTHNIMLPLRKK